MNVGNICTSSTQVQIQIVVPVYNEGKNISRLYDNLMSTSVPFDSLKFVYDFDEDNSLPVIYELAKSDNRISASKNEYGKGALNALKWGFSHAQNGPVIVVMGDCSDKLSIVTSMIDLWREGATIVCPSRYMKDGKQYGGGIVKSTLSRFAGISLKLIGFPTADGTNSFKLYDGKWLAQQAIESTGGFEVGLELCCKAFEQQKRITELPTEWFDRTDGESQFKLLKWLPLYLYWYLRIVGLLVRRVFVPQKSYENRDTI